MTEYHSFSRDGDGQRLTAGESDLLRALVGALRPAQPLSAEQRRTEAKFVGLSQGLGRPVAERNVMVEMVQVPNGAIFVREMPDRTFKVVVVSGTTGVPVMCEDYPHDARFEARLDARKGLPDVVEFYDEYDELIAIGSPVPVKASQVKGATGSSSSSTTE